MAGLKEKFYSGVKTLGNSINVANYVWEACIKPQLAYSFSRNHVLPYSAEALQEMNLYHFYDPVYWNCATLIVNAGLADEDNTKGVKYDKLAKGIYKALGSNIRVLPPSINDSELSFSPREEDESILFGLGSIASINVETANQIIENRPYSSFMDFYKKNIYKNSNITPVKLITLIKAGCFDSFNPNRVHVMKQFIVAHYPKKEKLGLQNMDEILRLRVPIPKDIRQPYTFRKYVCSKQFFYGKHPNFASKKLYWLDDVALKFFSKNCQSQLKEGVDYWEDQGMTIVVDKALEKFYAPSTNLLKEYINQPEFLKEYYKRFYRDIYDSTIGESNPNKWSFQAVSYYSLEHELAHADLVRYNIDHFSELPEEPVFIDRHNGKRSWKQFEINCIAGTVIAKNDPNHFFTILTPDNDVVNINMNRGQYAYYKNQISETDAEGHKKVLDKSWLTRGALVIVAGYRQEDRFVAKKYSKSIFQHTLVKIEAVHEDGSLDIISERYGSEAEED